MSVQVPCRPFLKIRASPGRDSRAGFEAFGWAHTRTGRIPCRIKKTRQFSKVQEVGAFSPC